MEIFAAFNETGSVVIKKIDKKLSNKKYLKVIVDPTKTKICNCFCLNTVSAHHIFTIYQLLSYKIK